MQVINQVGYVECVNYGCRFRQQTSKNGRVTKFSVTERVQNIAIIGCNGISYQIPVTEKQAKVLIVGDKVEFSVKKVMRS